MFLTDTVLYEPPGTVEGEDPRTGLAFQQCFLTDVPAQLLDFSAIFAGAPKLSAEKMSCILQHPSMVPGPHNIQILALYGVTPATVLDTLVCISLLLRRALRTSSPSVTQVQILASSIRPVSSNTAYIQIADVYAEVQSVIHLPTDTLKRLVDWVLQVAVFKPAICDGFFGQVQPSGLVFLEQTPPTLGVPDLTTIWSISAPASLGS